jgi:hypothetical protein
VNVQPLAEPSYRRHASAKLKVSSSAEAELARLASLNPDATAD